MAHYKIGVIPGDGIGMEVIPAGMRVLSQVAARYGFTLDFETFPWGCDYYLKTGQMMPEDGLEQLRKFDSIYLGAVGAPGVPDHVSLWGLLLPIRKYFDQYINLRPIKLFPGVNGPLRAKGPKDIDFVCVRENTEGEYAGVGGRLNPGTPNEVVLQTGVFTRRATERLIRYAFELAKGRRKKLASITKSNALQYSMVFWDEVVGEVAKEYPEVEVWSILVDAAAAHMVLRPDAFDVIVASNLFGDILSDLGGALQGSLGISPSGNLNPERTGPSLFEPVHGSAPDIAGRDIANPVAAIWTGALMLDFLGEAKAAAAIIKAIEATLADPASPRTPDLGGRGTTNQVTDVILGHLAGLARGI